MSVYSEFARYYDKLIYNVDYKQLAGYFVKLFECYGTKPSLLLDLACGTGNLSVEFSKLGIEVIGIDASIDMLSVARQKSMEQDCDILFLNQKMQELDLFGTVDGVVSSLDSINHLTCMDDVKATFDRVSLFLNSGGLFIFDVNTVYKHRSFLSGATFVYDLPDVYCVWQNDCVTRNNIVNMRLDFFVPGDKGYLRYSESVSERAYSIEEISTLLERSGMKLICVFDYLTMEAPKEKALKLVFIAKK